ncbi:MAG: sodium:alanine symporter family protein [Spirochaetes bacterium]|nr:sodium:alanine symporter family protein [Spirochaetota bacterium]
MLQLTKNISDVLWGYLLAPLLLGTGLFLFIRLRLLSIRKIGQGFKLTFTKRTTSEGKGEISKFEALCAGLASTIGIGNIAGVATAISLGGPGALFWMWVTAFLGMATRYTSGFLGARYRRISRDGTVSGGPMYYLTDGLNLKWLAVIFSLFTVIATLGIGNMVQTNTVARELKDAFGIPHLMSGLVIGLLVGLVIIGGIKRIGKVASLLTPVMSLVYIGGALIVLGINYQNIIPSFKLIFYHAFNPTAAAGGFAGSVVLFTMRMGVARGLFSNEAGLGSTPMIYAASKSDKPMNTGLVSMLGPFIDTIIVCTMTGLVIITSGLWQSGDTGAVLTARSFQSAFALGRYFVTFGIILFALSSSIGWSYYGDKSIEFLFGRKGILPYRIIYITALPVGAVFQLKLVWNFADIANALMALPNLVGLLLLSHLVVSYTFKK